MLAEATRHTIRCPVPWCGWKLGEVAAEGQAAFWRRCPKCGAESRYELPERVWVIERGPRRRC